MHGLEKFVLTSYSEPISIVIDSLFVPPANSSQYFEEYSSSGFQSICGNDSNAKFGN